MRETRPARRADLSDDLVSRGLLRIGDLIDELLEPVQLERLPEMTRAAAVFDEAVGTHTPLA